MTDFVGKARSWVINGENIEAVFVAVDAANNRVLFQTTDGCFRHFPLDALCAADWKFIRRTYKVPACKKAPKDK